ncbi:MAG TPA: MaoC/PaaZ C-terminal domain-containing protein [Thermodesulfobacteriota bacterium]|jgi:acyl dehydratase
MGLNRDYIGYETPSVVYEVTQESIYKYAWAIGSRNVTYYNYNGAMSGISTNGMAPPSFAVVHELFLAEKLWTEVGLHGGPEQLGRNLLMLVHGEQDMRFYKPIRPGDTISSRAKVKDIEDKGSGELLVINVISKNQNGETVVESEWGIFIRGIGSGQKPKTNGKKEQPPQDSSGSLLFRKIIRVPKDITYKYAEASGDRNPIHTDEKIAKAAGLRGIIVHGLCTLSITMRAIIECYLDSDPSKLRRLGSRFASPVYPGDTLVVDGWEMGKEDEKTVLGFEVTRRSDDVKVLRSGVAEVDI